MKIQLQSWEHLVDERIPCRKIHSEVVRSVVVLDVHGMKGGNGACDLTADLTIVNKREELVMYVKTISKKELKSTPKS